MKRPLSTIRPARLVFIAAFCCLAAVWTACNRSAGNQQISLALKDFVLEENPKVAPRELPTFFVYPLADITRSGVFRTDRFLTSPEGVVFFLTPDKPEAVIEHYTKKAYEKKWKIIQSLRNPGEHLLMFESPGFRFKRLVTVIMRGTGPTTIKVYFRKSDGS